MIWFASYILAIGSILIFVVLIQNWFLPDHPATPEMVGHRDAALILVALAFVTLTWRLCLFLKSDVERTIKAAGWKVSYVSGKIRGSLHGSGIEVAVDRPLLDYWPSPRGTREDVVCGRSVVRRVGGFNPRYMRRLASVTVWRDVPGKACRRVRLCSGVGVEYGGREAAEAVEKLDGLFGCDPGDWEVSFDDGIVVIRFRSGSWEGKTFERKLIWSMAYVLDDELMEVFCKAKGDGHK